MKRVGVCAECGELLSRVALTALVVSYEVDKETNEIFEQCWHIVCFVKYVQRGDISRS